MLGELHYIKGSRDLFVDVDVVKKYKKVKKGRKKQKNRGNHVKTFSRVLTVVNPTCTCVCVCLNVKVLIIFQ